MEAQLAKGSFGHLLCSESPRPSSSVWKQVEVLAPQLTNKGSLIDEEDNMREGGSDANNGTVAMTASSPKPSTKRPKKDEEMVYIQVHTSALPASQQLLSKLSDRPNPSGARSLQTLTAFVPKCGRDPLCTGPNQHCGHCKHLKVGGAAAAKRAAAERAAAPGSETDAGQDHPHREICTNQYVRKRKASDEVKKAKQVGSFLFVFV